MLRTDAVTRKEDVHVRLIRKLRQGRGRRTGWDLKFDGRCARSARLSPRYDDEQQGRLNGDTILGIQRESQDSIT